MRRNIKNIIDYSKQIKEKRIKFITENFVNLEKQTLKIIKIRTLIKNQFHKLSLQQIQKMMMKWKKKMIKILNLKKIPLMKTDLIDFY